MKKILLIIAMGASVSVSAQLADKEKELRNTKGANTSDSLTWMKGAVVTANFNQVALVNWAGGGQNTISTQGLISLFANYKKGKTTWDNNLDLAYGVVKQGQRDALWFKNDDRIELNSKFGHKLSKKWYYAALLNFRTQFNYGYSNVTEQAKKNYISNFMAPAYTVIGLGMDYKPNENFSAFIAPASSKLTFVNDDSLSAVGAYGVDPGQTFRAEIGGYIKMNYTKEKPLKMENVTFKTDITLFSNYLHNPQNIDITWSTLTNIKLNKYINMSFSTYLIYDDDIKLPRYQNNGITPIYMKKPDGSYYLDKDGNPIQKKGAITQFKEVWAVGLTYNF